MSEWDSPVSVTLIGEDGRAVLHRVVNPRGERFAAGMEELVDVLAPDLGEIAAVWVAPERGTLWLEGLTVAREENNAPTAMAFRCLARDSADVALEFVPAPNAPKTAAESEEARESGMSE